MNLQDRIIRELELRYSVANHATKNLRAALDRKDITMESMSARHHIDNNLRHRFGRSHHGRRLMAMEEPTVLNSRR